MSFPYGGFKEEERVIFSDSSLSMYINSFPYNASNNTFKNLFFSKGPKLNFIIGPSTVENSN